MPRGGIFYESRTISTASVGSHTNGAADCRCAVSSGIDRQAFAGSAFAGKRDAVAAFLGGLRLGAQPSFARSGSVVEFPAPGTGPGGAAASQYGLCSHYGGGGTVGQRRETIGSAAAFAAGFGGRWRARGGGLISQAWPESVKTASELAPRNSR